MMGFERTVLSMTRSEYVDKMGRHKLKLHGLVLEDGRGGGLECSYLKEILNVPRQSVSSAL